MPNRHRESSYLDVYPLMTIEDQPSGTIASIAIADGVFLKVIDDVLTPGWSRLNRSSRDHVNNPMSLTEAKISTYLGGGTVKYHHNDDPERTQEYIGNVTRYFANKTGFFVLSLPDLNGLNNRAAVDDMVSRAKLQAMSNIDNSLYAFGEDLGEFAETIRFIKKPLSSLKRLSYKFKRSMRKKLPKLLPNAQYRKSFVKPTSKEIAHVAADVWLEYRFAAAPLVRSTYDALLALGHNYVDRPDERIARGRVRYSFNKDDRIQRGSSTLDTFHLVENEQVEVRAGLRYVVENSPNDWRRLLGLRFKDLPTTAWQLVPLSFMVDRVVDISSMVTAGVNLLDPNIKILTGWVTTRRFMETSMVLDESELDGWTSQTTGNKITINDGSYERVVWDPSWSDTIPRLTPFRLIEDLTSIADLTTIIASRFKGK